MIISPMPTATLSNGLIVGNFSSGHSFTFTDGTMLAACEKDRVELGRATIAETRVAEAVRGITIFRIQMTPHVSEQCAQLLDHACYVAECDIVIVPLMILEAAKKLRGTNGHSPLAWPNLRVIRRDGRQQGEDHPRIHIDAFCA